MKNRKKILYIAAMGMGDKIASIPKLLDLRKKWYHITILNYDPRYFWLFMYKLDDIMEVYKKSNLFDEVIYVPYNKFKLIRFIIKHFKKFDQSYVTVKTLFSSIWGKLLWKNFSYTFNNQNENTKYQNIVAGDIGNNNTKPLFEYRKNLSIPYNPTYKKTFKIKGDFITLFLGSFERSANSSERKKVIEFLNKKELSVILIGWNREKRLLEDVDITKYKNIINIIGKTDFVQVASILSDAKINLSGNGGIMRLWHLLNPNNVSVHTTSSFIMQPPVNNKNSFNIRNYTYKDCKPCEALFDRFDWYQWIKRCIFRGTSREWECRRAITWENIIHCIEKILNENKK